MTKLQIQPLNSTSQLTAANQQQIYGGDNYTAEQKTYLLTLYVDGLATIETGNDPIDVRFRAFDGREIAEGVELYEN